MARDLIINIKVNDEASAAFRDLGTAASDATSEMGTGAGEASDELRKLQEEIQRLKDSLQSDLQPAAEGATSAIDDVGSAIDRATPESSGAGSGAFDKIKEELDGVKTSAEEAAAPIGTTTDGLTMLGGAMKAVGDEMPGNTGKVVKSFGELAGASDKVAGALTTVKALAVITAAVVGPALLVGAFNLAWAGAGKLAAALKRDGGLADDLDDIRAESDRAAASVNKVAFAMEDAATGFELAQTNAALDTTIDNLARLYEITQVFQGGNPAGDFATGAVEGITSYNEAGAEARRIAEELGIAWGNSEADLASLETALTAATSQQELFNGIMSHTGPGANDARERLADLNAQYASGQIDLETYNWNLQWINENLVTHYDMLAAAEAAQRQFAESAFNAAEKVGLLDTALEQMNAAGLNTDAVLAALALTGSALGSTFNTIVGTTNELASGSQAVADWAADLANAEEGISKLGRAYLDGRITLEEWSAGVEASTSIQEDNAIIQAEIQAIQARHLPLMADLTEQQRQYIEGLGDLSTEQQIAALGFMNSTQSAKAMELAYLAADAASGALGDTGTETASKIIEAAANADPVMRQMLIDMGLISEGAEGEVTVNFPNASSLTSSVDSLTASIDALTIALGGVPPSVNTTVNLNDNATGPLAAIKTALANLDGQTSTVYVNTIGGGLTLGASTGRTIQSQSRYVTGGTHGGSYAVVGEHGPELTWLPHGAQVTNAPSSRRAIERMNGRGDGRGVTYKGNIIHQSITLEESVLTRRSDRLSRNRR